MNARLIPVMGRIAGVTAAETRERLLRAAADVFAERGYDGTRVADIAAAAGVSNGALYAHFASKADLLVDALRTHGRHLLGELFAADPDRPVVDLLLTVGRWLPRRRDARGYLIVEALVAARRDEDVARPMRSTWASGATGWVVSWSSPRRAASSTRGCPRPPWPTSACCWRWAARWSRRTCTRPARTSGPPCWPGWRGRWHQHDREGNGAVKVQIDPERCQGHGRCYDLAPDLFGDDEEGYGQVLGDGTVPPDSRA